MSIIPPKLDAGNDQPRVIRQHTREIASWARSATQTLNSLEVTSGAIVVAFASHSDASDAIDGGLIPATAEVLVTEGYAAPGDGGDARYIRVTSRATYVTGTTTSTRTAGQNTLPFASAFTGTLVLGMTVIATGVPAGTTVIEINNNSIRLSDNLTADVGSGVDIGFGHAMYLEGPGGLWELDAPVPRLEMAGYFGTNAGTNPTGDFYEETLLLYAYLICRGGGDIELLAGHRYRLATSHQMPISVGYHQDGYQGYRRRTAASGGADFRRAPGLVLADGVTLGLNTNSAIRSMNVMREGVATSAPALTLADALDVQRDLSSGGTLLSISGGTKRSALIEEVTLVGADLGIDATGCPGLRLYAVQVDCNRLARITAAGGEVEIIECRRSAALVDGASIGLQVRAVVALYDDGGVTAATVSSAHGMVDGEICTADRLPWSPPYAYSRQYVEVIDNTNLRFPNLPWDADYATFTLQSNSDLSYVSGAASRILTIADSGGKIRVTTEAAMVFEVGHWCVLMLDGQDGQGWYQVLTVNSTTDFVLDVAWDAAYASTVLTYAELAAMPIERNGVCLYLDDVDGSVITGNDKGGDGIYLNGTNCNMRWSHEGGRQGELDLTKPKSYGLHLSERVARFNQFGGAWKSTRTALIVDARTPNEVNFFGVAFYDTGTAAMDFRRGTVRIFAPRGGTDGQARILVASGFTAADIYGGDFEPSTIVGAAADKPKIRFHAVDDPDGDDISYHAGSHRWQVYSAAGTPVDAGRLDANGWDLRDAEHVKVPAPTQADDAVRLSDLGTLSPLIGATSGTTAQALTTGGTAVSGTVSGYSLGSNQTAKKLRIEIVAQRTNGSGAGTYSESAMWDLNVLMSRGNNSSSTAVIRSAGLTSIAPTEYNDVGGTDPSLWTVTLTTSGASLVCNVLGASGADINWTAHITEKAVVAVPAPTASYRLLNAGGKRLLNAGGYRLLN